MQTSHEFAYGNSFRGIVERIAFEIGDAVEGDEFGSFDSAWIKARVVDTFKWLQARRPELFSHSITFKLEPGLTQTLPEDCDTLIEPLSICVDGETYPVYGTSAEAIRSAQVFTRLSKCKSQSVSTFHVATDDNDNRTIWVSPGIQPGKNYELTATCSSLQRYCKDQDLEIDCEVHKWLNMVVEYVKYLAMSADGENAVNANLANQHRAVFFDLAPVQRRQESDS